MLLLISRALAFCRRKISLRKEKVKQRRLLEGDCKLKTVQGVVTRVCDNYGLINELISFTNDVVTGGVLLKVGQKVTALVREDETSQGLKAIKVDILSDNCDAEEPADSGPRILFGCVSSTMENDGLVYHTTYFSLDVVCKGYEPYEGDWIEAEFSLEPGTWSQKAISVKPWRHKHVNEVCITSFCGRSGVIDDNIFFTLDSLKLPDGYVPQVSDIVNAVVVERANSVYVWRALSMTPVNRKWLS